MKEDGEKRAVGVSFCSFLSNKFEDKKQPPYLPPSWSGLLANFDVLAALPLFHDALQVLVELITTAIAAVAAACVEKRLHGGD